MCVNKLANFFVRLLYLLKQRIPGDQYGSLMNYLSQYALRKSVDSAEGCLTRCRKFMKTD